MISMRGVETILVGCERGERAVKRALDGDPNELHGVLAAGYTAAVFVFRRKAELPAIAKLLEFLLKRGDPGRQPRGTH